MQVFIKTNAMKLRLIKRNKSQNWLAVRMKICSGYMSQLMNNSRGISGKLRQRLMDIFPECMFNELFIIKKDEGGR
jgi:plasmid maintenance system antidote protein VapI